MVCTKDPLVTLFLQANPNRATNAFILVKNVALTGRARIYDLAICGEQRSYAVHRRSHVLFLQWIATTPAELGSP